MTDRFIALDWGTTSFRAYLADSSGVALDQRASPTGILSVKDGDFERALETQITDWSRDLPVLAAGMITSRQGWIELPYLPCPAGAADIASALHSHRTLQGRTIWFATGLSCRADDGTPDVMRSEETQVFGSLSDGLTHFVAPGTHSKWIATENGRIASFATYMTGEVFAVLKGHTILGKLMTDGRDDDDAFLRGAKMALADPGGFLHRIFSARSLALFGELAPASVSSFLSGQVIGTEVAHAAASNPGISEYCILASPALASRYMKVLAAAGLKARLGSADCIVKGLAEIARSAGLVR